MGHLKPRWSLIKIFWSTCSRHCIQDLTESDWLKVPKNFEIFTDFMSFWQLIYRRRPWTLFGRFTVLPHFWVVRWAADDIRERRKVDHIATIRTERFPKRHQENQGNRLSSSNKQTETEKQINSSRRCCSYRPNWWSFWPLTLLWEWNLLVERVSCSAEDRPCPEVQQWRCLKGSKVTLWPSGKASEWGGNSVNIK